MLGLKTLRRRRQWRAAEAARFDRRLLLHASARPLGDNRKNKWLINWVIGSMIFAFFWAAITPVTEAVTGSGRILPAGGERSVQTLAGGLVEIVHAREGDLVVKGATLVTFDRSEEQQQLRRLAARWEGRTAELFRMRAIVEGVPFNAPESTAGREQMTAYQADLRLNNAVIERLQVASVAADRQIVFSATRIDILRQQLDLAQKASQRADDLLATGAINTRTSEDATSAELRVALDLAEAESQEAQARVVAAEANLALTRHLADQQSKAAERAATLALEIAELNEEISRVSDLASRDRVVAPVSGRIQDLTVTDTGQTVIAGGTVAIVVPDQGELYAELQVNADRVGEVSEGLTASVRILAYDAARFGNIPGEVVAISPTSDVDNQGNAFFRVRIRLDVDANSMIDVRPGLSVQADLETGTKTVLQYFAKPIHVLQDRALSEA